QVPEMTSRKVDTLNNSIEVGLYFKQYDFNPKVVVTAKGKGVKMSVILDEPLPEQLIGKAGFNFEFLPSAYFEKSFLADTEPGHFPLYPSDSTTILPVSEKIPQFSNFSTFDDRGKDEFLVPAPFATADSFVFAPGDLNRKVKI